MTGRQGRSTAFVCAAVMAAVLFVFCPDAEAAPRAGSAKKNVRLVVSGISPGQYITDHEWGYVRIEVGAEAERQKAPRRKQPGSARTVLKVKVDGREVAYRLLDSRTVIESRRTYAYRTLGIPLGEPGPKSVTLVLGSQSQTIPVVFAPTGRIEMAGLFDEQAVFGGKGVPMEWFGCYLVKESVRATINGRDCAVEVIGEDGAMHLLEGRTEPAGRIVPGKNTISIEAVDVMGNVRERRVSFSYYPENKVIVGDVFVVSLGTEESAGCPFFDATVEGASIVKRQDLTGRPGPEMMGGRMLLTSGKAVLNRFEAIAPGKSLIRVSEKQHRMDTAREKESIRILVQTPAQAARIDRKDVAGHTLRRIEAAGLFTCLLPDGWVLLPNPDGERDVRGFSTHRPGQGQAPGAGFKFAVEYYPRDNGSGLHTVDQYVSATLGAGADHPAPVREIAVAERPAKRFSRNVSLAVKALVFFTKRVPVVEEFVVVPDPGGFYVLRSMAPAAAADDARGLFEALVDSFEPLK